MYIRTKVINFLYIIDHTDHNPVLTLCRQF